jgi:foldase protein PrsA
MIDERLVRQEAEKLGIVVDSDAVKAKVQEVIAIIGSRGELEKRLEQLHMTMEELERRAEVLALLDALVRKHVTVSEGEIAAYYQEHRKDFSHGPMVKARLMLFSTKESAEAVMTALKAGGDFAGLAKQLSEDPGTRDAGGDTGWFESEDYAPEISKMAFSLRPGQLSPVFKGPDGWYILRVEEKRPAGEEPMSEVRRQVETRLLQEKMLTLRTKWLIDKRQGAAVVVKDRRLANAVKGLLAKAPPPAPLPGLITPDSMFVPEAQVEPSSATWLQ